MIVDEISFTNEYTLRKINRHLNILKEAGCDGKFGGIPVLFAGDFTQLEPVKGRPIWFDKTNEIWYDYVNTFIELKTNHRFNCDCYNLR